MPKKYDYSTVEQNSMEQSTAVIETTQEPTQKKKPGPPARPKVDMKHIDQLNKRIEALESVVIRMAHNSGTAHAILKKAGLEPYNPSKADMSRFERTK
jgi:hypothetical protein